MRRYIKNAVAALLAVVIILSTYVPVVAVGQPSSYSSSENSGTRDVVCTTLNGTSALDYYGDNYSYDKLSTQSATAIKSALKTLMTSTHSYTSSYNDCHYKADKTDCENGNGKISLIYTGYSATQSQWNGWNREHVWPKSLGGNTTTGGGADMHHIRPSDAVVNSTRSNDKYGNVNGGKQVYGSNPASGYLGGYSGGGYFEPLDNVKGDVARICLYVYVRWGSEWGADSISEVFQSIDVLLEWCALDPVDTWEMGRNEVIEAIQGNRNVFIDYPEYAWLIFGEAVPSNMITPSGEAANGGNNQGGGQDEPHTHSYTSSITKQPTCTATGVETFTCSCGSSYTNSISATGHSYSNGTCTKCGATNTPATCTHSNTEIKGAFPANCFDEGYTGDVYCSDCGALITRGSDIPTTNAHDFGDWELDANGNYVKHCDTCGISATLTLDTLLSGVESDAEKILILLTLGVTDSAILDALSK